MSLRCLLICFSGVCHVAWKPEMGDIFQCHNRKILRHVLESGPSSVSV